MSFDFKIDITRGIAYGHHADAKPVEKKAPLPPFSPRGQSPNYWSSEGVVILDEPKSKVPCPVTAESKKLESKGLERKDVQVLTHLVTDESPAEESENY